MSVLRREWAVNGEWAVGSEWAVNSEWDEWAVGCVSGMSGLGEFVGCGW